MELPFLVDTHCHLDQYPDPLKVAREAEAAGVKVIAVTALPSHFQAGQAPVSNLKHVRQALGLHPLMAEQHATELRLFDKLLGATSYVGEVGLDNSRHGRASYETQVRTFEYVLERLQGLRKFVSLHSRGAERAVLSLVDEYRVGPVVFHWFSGPLEIALDAASRGHFFSVNPAMVKTEKGKLLVRSIPRDRILAETDGPYVTIGSRAATPSDIERLQRDIAAIWGTTSEAVAEQIKSNFRSVTNDIRVNSLA